MRKTNYKRFSGRVAGSWRGTALLCAALLLTSATATLPATAAAGSSFHRASKDRGRAYLGIEFHDTSEEQVAALHLQGPHGAEIFLVDHDGPAGQAGLEPHDIVVQLDGQNIDTADSLSKRIRESAPGRVIILSIVRLGRAMTVTAKLADVRDMEHDWKKQQPSPSDDGVENILVQRYGPSSGKTPPHGTGFIGTMLRTSPYTGASLEVMEPQLAGFFGVPPKTGLLVHEVKANSPAAAAGLHAGDVVLRMDSIPVATVSDWTTHLRTNKGLAVVLTVLRDHHELTMTMQTVKTHSMVETPKFF